MRICCYCERPIVGSTGWGMSENLDGSDERIYHLECGEMNGENVVVYV